MELQAGTRVVITGASRGIGRALAGICADRGATLGLVARSAAELDQLAAELGRAGGRAIALPADVGEHDQVEQALDSFIEQTGGIDVLVANAGVAWYGPVRKMPLEEAERMTRVNWLGTVYTVTAALPQMLDQAEGNIVIVCSAAGHRSFPWAAVYGATKFAQRGFLEALRHELSGTGLAVTGVYPGEVKTHLHDDDLAAGRMPDWYRIEMAVEPQRLARQIVAAVESDRPELYFPRITRTLGLAHGISPRLADRMLRRILGAAAAPWRG